MLFINSFIHLTDLYNAIVMGQVFGSNKSKIVIKNTLALIVSFAERQGLNNHRIKYKLMNMVSSEKDMK